jgi:hypothetical protein
MQLVGRLEKTLKLIQTKLSIHRKTINITIFKSFCRIIIIKHLIRLKIILRPALKPIPRLIEILIKAIIIKLILKLTRRI